jgi:hypothetical protein
VSHVCAGNKFIWDYAVDSAFYCPRRVQRRNFPTIPPALRGWGRRSAASLPQLSVMCIIPNLFSPMFPVFAFVAPILEIIKWDSLLQNGTRKIRGWIPWRV